MPTEGNPPAAVARLGGFPQERLPNPEGVNKGALGRFAAPWRRAFPIALRVRALPARGRPRIAARLLTVRRGRSH